jgi:hypothetical protein
MRSSTPQYNPPPDTYCSPRVLHGVTFMVIVVSRWARRTTCRSRSRRLTATPSRWPSAQRRCWPSAVPPPPRKIVARLCNLIEPLVWLWAGTTPYSLTWTQSGNVNRNATHFSMVNMLGNVVSVNATTVLSAVASQTNSTNGLYVLCTRLPPINPPSWGQVSRLT